MSGVHVKSNSDFFNESLALQTTSSLIYKSSVSALLLFLSLSRLKNRFRTHKKNVSKKLHKYLIRELSLKFRHVERKSRLFAYYKERVTPQREQKV